MIRDRSWGSAVEVSVHDGDSSDLLNRLLFGFHPEFAGYDALQAMTTNQFIALAQDGLASGGLDTSLATWWARTTAPCPPCRLRA